MENIGYNQLMLLVGLVVVFSIITIVLIILMLLTKEKITKLKILTFVLYLELFKILAIAVLVGNIVIMGFAIFAMVVAPIFYKEQKNFILLEKRELEALNDFYKERKKEDFVKNLTQKMLTSAGGKITGGKITI